MARRALWSSSVVGRLLMQCETCPDRHGVSNADARPSSHPEQGVAVTEVLPVVVGPPGRHLAFTR